MSEVSICNEALQGIGSNTIVALTDDSKQGRLCNLMYSSKRDALLQAHNWNFAIKRVALAQLTTSPVYGYDYAYQLPADSLRIVSTDVPFSEQYQAWKVEAQTIACDESSVKVEYIAQITDTSKFSALFTQVLVAELAKYFAIPLEGDRDLALAMYQIAELELKKARFFDASEDGIKQLEATTWISARL